MRVYKRFLLDVLKIAEDTMEGKDFYVSHVRDLRNCVLEMPGALLEIRAAEEETPDNCIKGGRHFFEQILKDVSETLNDSDRRKTDIDRILRGMNNIVGEMMISSPSNYIAVTKWEESDLKAAFSDAGIEFTEERLKKVLPAVLAIINDRSEMFDKIIQVIEETFSADEDPRVLWQEFGKVKKDRVTRKLTEPWKQFPAGTAETTVWSWFEKKFGISIEDLIYQKVTN